MKSIKYNSLEDINPKRKFIGYMALVLALAFIFYMFIIPLGDLFSGQKAIFTLCLTGKIEVFKTPGGLWGFKEKDNQSGVIRALTCIEGKANHFWPRFLSRILTPVPLFALILIIPFGYITGKKVYLQTGVVTFCLSAAVIFMLLHVYK